jgi:glycosyltransferase involved in cell wall biosynthesis
VTVRVGFDTTYGLLSRTGIGRYVRSLQGALEGLGETELVPLAPISRPSASRVRRIAEGVAREGWWYPARVERQALRKGCAVLHCPQPVFVRARRLPLVITVPDLLPLEQPELFRGFPRVQARASLPALRRADRILTYSEHTRQAVIERLGVSPEGVVTTPLGVGDAFRPSSPDESWLRDRFGIAAPFVLCVGTLEPRKNLAMALRAFETVSSRVPDTELVVVGPPGWRNREFDRLLQRSRTPVHMAGFVSDSDLSRLYSATSCFLYPSQAEGFGLPVAEALACGAPVVTSDRTSLPEVAGGASLLVDPGNADSIADAVQRVLEDEELRGDLRRRALARAHAFSWERCAQLTSRVYRVLADGSRRLSLSTRS